MPRTCAIVGVGGLGAPAAALLGALSSCDLRLIDDDLIEISNLPRQPLYGINELGQSKAGTAARHIEAGRASGSVEIHEERLTPSNVTFLLQGADIVIDGSDSLATKRLLNQWCCSARTPLIHAGVLGWDGQLTTILPGTSACLACLFTDLSEDQNAPSCEQDGVVGPVAGAIGLAAAREALAILQGTTPSLAGRFATFDGRSLVWRSLAFRRRPECPSCGELA